MMRSFVRSFTTEVFDTPQILEDKIKTLAEWIWSSNYCISFTGAGVSTSAGIPDYRSTDKTILPTGPGIWERKAHFDQSNHMLTDSIQAFPTVTHMALAKLVEDRHVKHVVSQNVDGLHRKSGVPPHLISELHGSNIVEECSKCSKNYLRDFKVYRENPGSSDKRTGRQCDDPVCKGDLRESIVYFSEKLDQNRLKSAFGEAVKADLCISIGSSLRVRPAALIPKFVGSNKNLVIVNLQNTPLDSMSKLKINGISDHVMQRLMEVLGIQIPKFKLVRRVSIGRNKDALTVMGVDVDLRPFSIFKGVEIHRRDCIVQLTEEPFVFRQFHTDDVVVLRFQGHYGEPEVKIKVPELQEAQNKVFELTYDPFNRVWEEINTIS